MARNGVTFIDPYVGAPDAPPAPNTGPSSAIRHQAVPVFVPLREKTTVGQGCAAVVGGTILLLLIASVFLVLVGGRTRGVATSASHPPAADVEISRCFTDEFGYAEMELMILNHSSEPSTYLVNVQWQSADGKVQFGTSIGSASHLESGQTINVQVPSVVTPNGSFVCRVTDVTRFASP